MTRATALKTTEEKVKESLRRLTAACEAGFAPSVRVNLLIETVHAQITHQVAISEALVAMMEEHRANNENLYNKVSAYLESRKDK